MNSSINKKIFNHIARSPMFFSKNNISFMSRKCDDFYLGFILPRSIGSAVNRNNFKRKCRAAFYEIKNKKPSTPFGVIVKPKNITLDFTKIHTSFNGWIEANNEMES